MAEGEEQKPGQQSQEQYDFDSHVLLKMERKLLAQFRPDHNLLLAPKRVLVSGFDAVAPCGRRNGSPPGDRHFPPALENPANSSVASFRAGPRAFTATPLADL